MPLRRAPSLLALAIAILAIWAYWPGLHGGFLFDDFINLPTLGAEGPNWHWSTFWRYLTSGHADPTGRPLALLSFLVDGHDWPTDPFPFKRTNLVLHLINGGLLAALLQQLGRRYVTVESEAVRHRLALAAVLGAAIWLLHPFLVSTTLYIVQREAILPATFTLAGLLAWLHARNLLLRGVHRQGTAWLLFALGVCTALAVLSKANGILLPCLALVIEFTLPRDRDTPEASSKRYYRGAMWILAGAPSLLVLGYLVHAGWQGATHDLSAVRPWTLGQRLLTEPSVLVEYLKLLWLPRPFTTGLFNDQIVASTSLLHPASTLVAVLFVTALLLAALFLRRRQPVVSLAILFYFVGQSMESSTIALELYFEHRNYLPAALLFWPLALWLCRIPLNPLRVATQGGDRLLPWAKAISAGLIVVGLGLMTHARASLWGDSHDQALLWAKLNPGSPRAQANAAMAESSAGHPERAIARLAPLLRQQPDQVQFALNLLSASCSLGYLEDGTIADSRRALQTTRDTGTLLTSWFEQAIDNSQHPVCPELNLATLRQLLDAASANSKIVGQAGRRQDLDYLKGRIALMQGDAPAALTFFNRALDQQVRPAIALRQAALLGSAGYPDLGLRHLEHYDAVSHQEERPDFGMPRIHAWVLQKQGYWEDELRHLRHTLVDDSSTQSPPPQ